MRAFSRVLVCLVLVVGVAAPAAAQPEIDEDVLYLFWGDGCPHCASEKEFLGGLVADNPSLTVEEYEVWYDLQARSRFEDMMAALGEEPRAVPTTVYGGRVWLGFDDSVATELRAAVSVRLDPDDGPVVAPGRTIDVPLLGPVDPAGIGLVPATLAIAVVDGLNPCSLWALSILLALVLRTGSRRRVFAVGAVFLVVTTVLYGLFIGGMYGALSYAADTAWIRFVMAGVALAFGVVNLKDYVWFKQGLSLSIPARAKPRVYARMRSVAHGDRRLPAVLAGTAGLAVGVSLLETPCTAGYPLLWSDMVADSEVGFSTAAGLFGLYMVVFLLDELVIFGGAVIAMRTFKLQERGGRLLKLVSGALMVTLAATLLVDPEAMTTLGGAGAVFGVAASLALVIVVLDAAVMRRSATASPQSASPRSASPHSASPDSGSPRTVVPRRH